MSRCFLFNQIRRKLSTASKPLVCFDIDGVLLRGHLAIPRASDALRLLKSKGIPYMFLTNGSPCTEKQRIEQLNQILGVDNSNSIMLMAQSPLRELTELYDKNILFIGQGNIDALAKSIGFKNVYSPENIKAAFPLLDAVPKHINLSKIKPEGKVPKIDGIIIFNEPINYETSLQYIIDVICTNGLLDHSKQSYPISEPSTLCNNVPIIAMCTDYLWVAEAPWLRIAVGFFLACLEESFQKIAGTPLIYDKIYGKPCIGAYQYLLKCVQAKYQAQSFSHIYFVGDNIFTDIYGANTFKNYIKQNPNDNQGALQVKSVLVQSGVYKNEPIKSYEKNLRLLHRDTPHDTSLLYPDYIHADAYEAIKSLFSS